jgi:hypothetical protein
LWHRWATFSAAEVPVLRPAALLRCGGGCTNLLTIRRDLLEATVLDALRHRLMEPELYAVFVAEFTAEWNRLQADAGAGLAARRSELTEVRRWIDGMIRAIEEGLYQPSMKTRMEELERRREVLEAELATATEPKPRLHPGLAEIYRQKVAALHEALSAGAGRRCRRRSGPWSRRSCWCPTAASWRSRCGVISPRSWRWAKRRRPAGKGGSLTICWCK